MKKIIITVFALLIFGFTLTAQEKQKSFEWNRTTMTELGISTERQQKLEQIIGAFDNEIAKAGKDKSLDKEQQKEKKLQLRKDREKAIMAELTKEEKQKVKEMRERIKAANN